MILQFNPAPKTEEISKPPFEEVFSHYYSRILSYLESKLGNYQDAEDLCSEAFLYCLDHYDSYDPEKSSISTWIYLVVNSRLKNFYRDKRSFADIDELQNVIPDDRDDMEQAVYLQQLRQILADALQTLPEVQKKIVVARYFQQKTSTEIAEELGLTPGNVRVLLSRALDKLEKQCGSLKL